ncbi:rubrerythrin family protein [bacterium]|nr:rubrerythrin family protein [candidate division CSSED10-310 bacterium]
MKGIQGTRTEQNLLKSFAGESQARNRYDMFAKQAKKEGFEQIAAIFEETALHEQQHAKRMFEFLEGGMVEITAMYPAGKVGTTLENLTSAAAGENEEWSELYPAFARIAREEGFEAVAKLYEHVCISERHHEQRYLKLAGMVEAGMIFRRSQDVVWTCRKCGYTHSGKEPLKACPACAHPMAYFERIREEW